MKYTKYFSLVNQHHGLQKLSSVELGRLFNIVHVEGRIKECDEFMENPSRGDDGRVSYRRYQSVRLLRELTGEKLPSDLMKEMYSNSQE